jgi:hypothetical protein
MKRRLVLAVSLLAALCAVPLAGPVSTVKANPVGVYVYNTTLVANKGLQFCAPGVVKGCIDSITVNGVQLTQVNSPSLASYQIGGGLYGGPCRFVDTTVSQCEFPYLVLFPYAHVLGPNASLGDVVINFRRQATEHPTSAVNAVIVNGSLQSFSPAAPGLRDVASISARAVEIHSASTGYCIGWVSEIDGCVIGETGTSKVTNRLSMLLLPAMRSSIVPPDKADETCRQIDISNACIINVFDETSRGGWVDTDASVFGLTSTDRFTGAAQLKIAGPHYKTPVNGSTDLNQSYFRMFMPKAYLDVSFGLTPSQANATSLPVKRTARNGSTVPVTQYIPSADGLLVSSTGIGFSTPTMSVQRILTVKRNQKVTATTLLKAAGVHQSLKFGKASVKINSKNGMKYSAKRYQFTKVRTLTVTIKYRSTKLAISERRLTVNVVR